MIYYKEQQISSGNEIIKGERGDIRWEGKDDLTIIVVYLYDKNESIYERKLG